MWALHMAKSTTNYPALIAGVSNGRITGFSVTRLPGR
jgi:hypothetical protein